MALLRYLRPSTLRKCTQTCRGEVSCVTATFTLVAISFVVISVFNISKAPTILTILDDLPLDVRELQKDTLNTILLEQENGEVYIAFRLNGSASLIKKLYNVRDAFRSTSASIDSSSKQHKDLTRTIKPTEQALLKADHTQTNKDTKRDLQNEYGIVYPLPSYNSQYLINSKNLCTKQKTLSFIVLVHTATENFMRRSSIRETWANSMLFNNHSMKIVFLLGKPTRESTQTLIEHEQKMYKDLVQGDFIDSYHNLTHKGVLGLRWVSEYCSQAKFIVKVDDDVFVNVFKLLQRMESEMHNKTRHIWCPTRPKGTSVIQRGSGKWKVNDNEFKNMTHFNVSYCNGFFVVLSSDIIKELFEASKRTPFFWIDDVYLFGLLPDKIGNVTHQSLPNLNLNEKEAITCFESKDKPCNMLVANAHSDGVMDKLWFAVLEQYKTLAKKYSKETLFMKTS